MFTPGTIWHSLWRGVMVFIIFGTTTALAEHPEWGAVTIGSLLMAAVHYLEKQITA